MRVILKGYIASLLHELYLRYWLYEMPEHEEFKYRLRRIYLGE